MAFCTSCGAQVQGAFCVQCGTPVSATGAASPAAPQAQAPQAMPPGAYVGAVPVAPVKRGTSPLVWVLVIVLGLFVLGVVGVVGTGFFLVHKARQAGLDPDLMSRNPGYAAAKLLITANPDLEEVRHDDGAGTITIRDRKTGKVSTLNFDDIKNGKFKITAEDENGKVASMEIGSGSNAKLPSWVPDYPGSQATGSFSVKGASNDGSGEGGTYAFTTKDSASQVTQFYQDKAKGLGMQVNLQSSTADGGMIVANDEGNNRTLMVVVGRSGSETSVSVTYGLKK